MVSDLSAMTCLTCLSVLSFVYLFHKINDRLDINDSDKCHLKLNYYRFGELGGGRVLTNNTNCRTILENRY